MKIGTFEYKREIYGRRTYINRGTITIGNKYLTFHFKNINLIKMKKYPEYDDIRRLKDSSWIHTEMSIIREFFDIHPFNNIVRERSYSEEFSKESLSYYNKRLNRRRVYIYRCPHTLGTSIIGKATFKIKLDKEKVFLVCL